jgi:hypothetical protein
VLLNDLHGAVFSFLSPTPYPSWYSVGQLTGASESMALRELRQLAALGIVGKSKETGQSAHCVYVKTEPVTDKSNNPGLTATVTLKDKRFIQEKREKNNSLTGTKTARRGTVTAPVMAPVEAQVGAQVEAQVTPQVTLQVAPQVAPQVGAHDEAHELTEIEKGIMTATASKPCGTPELLIIPTIPTAACKNTVSPTRGERFWIRR